MFDSKNIAKGQYPIGEFKRHHHLNKIRIVVENSIEVNGILTNLDEIQEAFLQNEIKLTFVSRFSDCLEIRNEIEKSSVKNNIPYVFTMDHQILALIIGDKYS